MCVCVCLCVCVCVVFNDASLTDVQEESINHLLFAVVSHVEEETLTSADFTQESERAAADLFMLSCLNWARTAGSANAPESAASGVQIEAQDVVNLQQARGCKTLTFNTRTVYVDVVQDLITSGPHLPTRSF